MENETLLNTIQSQNVDTIFQEKIRIFEGQKKDKCFLENIINNQEAQMFKIKLKISSDSQLNDVKSQHKIGYKKVGQLNKTLHKKFIVFEIFLNDLFFFINISKNKFNKKRLY